MKTRLILLTLLFSIIAPAMQAQDGGNENNSVFNVTNVINSDILNSITENKKADDKMQLSPFRGHIPLFYLGMSSLSNSPSVAFNSNLDNVPQNHRKSYEWGMYLLKKSIPILNTNSFKCGIVSALGFSNSINYLKGGYVVKTVDDHPSYIQPDEKYSRAWLNQWRIHLPFLFEMQLPVKRNSGFFLSTGPEFEFIKIRSRGVLNGDKQTIESVVNEYPFCFSLLTQVGYDDWGIISRIGFTPILEDNQKKRTFNSMITFFVYL